MRPTATCATCRRAEERPAAIRGEAWAELGVNVEQDFEPVYIVPKEKAEHVRRLKRELRRPTSCSWRRTRTARARASAGISASCWSRGARGADRLPRGHAGGRSRRRCARHGTSTRTRRGAGRRGASSTGCSATACRRCCGGGSGRGRRPGACRASPCGSRCSGSASGRPSARRLLGRRGDPRRGARHAARDAETPGYGPPAHQSRLRPHDRRADGQERAAAERGPDHGAGLGAGVGRAVDRDEGRGHPGQQATAAAVHDVDAAAGGEPAPGLQRAPPRCRSRRGCTRASTWGRSARG